MWAPREVALPSAARQPSLSPRRRLPPLFTALLEEMEESAEGAGGGVGECSDGDEAKVSASGLLPACPPRSVCPVILERPDSRGWADGKGLRVARKCSGIRRQGGRGRGCDEGTRTGIPP